MGAYCSKAADELCGGCGFTCSCTTCAQTGEEIPAAACDCSCRFMVVRPPSLYGQPFSMRPEHRAPPCLKQALASAQGIHRQAERLSQQHATALSVSWWCGLQFFLASHQLAMGTPFHLSRLHSDLSVLCFKTLVRKPQPVLKMLTPHSCCGSMLPAFCKGCPNYSGQTL